MNTSAHAQTLLAPLLGRRLAANLAGAGVLAFRLRAGDVVQGEAALLDGSCRDVLLRRRSGREQEQGPHVFDAFGQPRRCPACRSFELPGILVYLDARDGHKFNGFCDCPGE